MDLSTKELKELQQIIEPIILTAGIRILSSWTKIQSIRYKDKRDVVTNVDIEVENYIRSELTKIFPDAGFYVEEGITDTKAKYNWAIDPIDGTKYYAHLLPFFVTQIALLENNVPILGIVLNPVTNQLFSASRGNGTVFNGQVMLSKARSRIEESVIDLDFGGPDEEIDQKTRLFNKLAKHFYRVRIFGGTMVSYIVTGAIDAYLVPNRANKIVDIAPNIIILKEAGLTVDSIDVPHYRPLLCAANKELFNQVKKLLVEV